MDGHLSEERIEDGEGGGRGVAEELAEGEGREGGGGGVERAVEEEKVVVVVVEGVHQIMYP